MSNCIFCNKTGEWLCENELAFAFYDTFPVNEGHTLVVPKRHLVSYFDATPEELAAVTDLIFKVKELLEAMYQPDGYNIGVNVGEAGGQSVFHLHVHVIPRYLGDVKNPRGGVRKIKKSVVPYPLEEDTEDDVYNRLVRDGIPEIIRKTGKVPLCRVADENEYAWLLREKLWEKVRELARTNEVEELADIVEVIKAIAADKGVEFAEILKIAEVKAVLKGSFSKRIVLERIADE